MTLLESIQQRHMYMDARVSRIQTLEAELGAVTGELVSAQDQLLAMFDLSKTLCGFTDLESLSETVAREALRLLPAKAVMCIVGGAGVAPQRTSVGTAALSDTAASALLELVQARGRSLLLRASEALEQVHPGQEVLCVPVEVQGRIQAILVWVDRKGVPFTSPDVKLGLAVAVQVGAAIENVLLYHRTFAQEHWQTGLEPASGLPQRMELQVVSLLRV